MYKNIVECRDQLTMRKDNYVQFVTTNGNPRDIGSKSLDKRGTLPKFKNLQKGTAKEKLKKETLLILLLQLKEKFKTIYLKPEII